MKNYIIFEIDAGISLSLSPLDWVKHSPNLWKIKYSWLVESRDFSYGSGAWGYGAYGGSDTLSLPTPENAPVLTVGSLIVDGISYTTTTSPESAELINNSYYFDKDDQVIYVHFDGDTSPVDYVDIALGATEGYSNFPFYYDDVEYVPRVVSIPSSTIERDSFFFGQTMFSGGTVTLNNEDHYFDTFYQNDIFGKICRIKYSEDLVTFSTLYVGKLQDYAISGSNITINIKDPRKGLLGDIILNSFDLDTYPDIKEDNVGTTIPIGFGIVKSSAAICTNEENTATTYDFKFFDTTYGAPQSIQEIRVGGVVVAASASSMANGTFSLSSSDYEPGNDVEIDYTGIDLTNPLDIIKRLLANYFNVPYTVEFYDLVNWEAQTAAITTEVGIGIIEPRAFIDIIGDISQSVFGSLIVNGAGQYSFKTIDTAADPVMELYSYDYIEAPSVSYKFNEYVSTVSVNYNTGLISKTGPNYINDTQEQTLFNKYDNSMLKPFDTLLTNSTDAIAYSNTMLDLFGGVFPTYTLRTKLVTLDIELEDVIDAQLYYFDRRYYNVRLQVLSKTVDNINNTIEITGRYLLYTDQAGNIIDELPSGAKLIRQAVYFEPLAVLPNDVIIQWDEDPSYIFTYDDIPDYVIKSDN